MKEETQTETMIKHTPGEWTAVKADLYSDGEESDPDRWAVCADIGGQQFFIATIENGAPGDTMETEGANARLFAAAKDLLAACKSLIRTLEQYATGGDVSGLLSVRDARAAISKAQSEE